MRFFGYLNRCLIQKWRMLSFLYVFVNQVFTVGFSYMVGVPGFLARFLARIFGQILGDRRYTVQTTVVLGQRNTLYSTSGTEKYSSTALLGRRKTRKHTMHQKFHVLKFPYILSCPMESFLVLLVDIFLNFLSFFLVFFSFSQFVV